MKTIAKSTLAVMAGTLAVAGSIAVPTAVSAWGDSAGGRPSYTLDEINAGTAITGNTPIFNTISDSVIGDEKNFVSVRAASDDPKGYWHGNEMNVEDGQEYVLRIYAHNNNPNGMDAVSHDTKVAFSIPSASSTTVKVSGFITSSNAVPNKYWDSVELKADQPFHLEYIYGSALLVNNGIGAGKGVTLPDDIVTKATSYGTKIGYTALDGEVPGCYTYDNFVTIRVKVVYDAEFTITKKVRLEGTKEWQESVDAKVGDRVEYQIGYKNTSDETQLNVMIRDILPNNMAYVAGTTKLWNSKYTGATLTPDGDVVADGVNIGGYTAGSNAYVRFTAEVVDKNLACGHNTLTNWAQVTIGTAHVEDDAVVTLTKTGGACDVTPTEDVTTSTPTELPSTGPEAIIGGVIATGSVVTAAGYLIASRRELR